MNYEKANRDGDKMRQRASQPAESLLIPRANLMEKAAQAFQQSLQATRKRKKK